jgi:predicted metal-dependent HD superfamily phosphohydrolase
METMLEKIDFYTKKPLNVLEGAIARVPVPLDFKDGLKNSYLSYGRFYHGAFHIAQQADLHHQLTKLFGISFSYNDEIVLYSTMVYHDLHYVAGFAGNERESKNIWLKHRTPKGNFQPLQSETDLVADIIMESANHLVDREFDENNPNHLLREWFLGLDTISLATPYEMFLANNLAIRAEFAFLNDDTWRDGRTAFLDKMLEKKEIFLHPNMKIFESKARENIKKIKLEV